MAFRWEWSKVAGYWTREIADSIVQLKNIRYDNPMFSLTTTFTREDFTRLMQEKFEVSGEQVEASSMLPGE